MRTLTTLAAPLALALAAGASHAANIALNPSPAGLTTSNTVMDARYRLSNTNWDHMIATSSSISGSTLVQTANLGTHNQLNARSYDFSLDYSPSAGWTWALTPVTSGTASTVTWSAPFNGVSPFRSFNGLELFIVAANMNEANIAQGSVSVTNMALSAPGATVTGSLVDLNSVWTGTGTGGLVSQFVVSDTDMSTFAWTLTGRLVASFTYQPGFSDPGGNLDERLKFDIKATTVVPAPGAGASIALAGLVSLRRRR